jgi:hypothetical protein
MNNHSWFANGTSPKEEDNFSEMEHFRYGLSPCLLIEGLPVTL